MSKGTNLKLTAKMRRQKGSHSREEATFFWGFKIKAGGVKRTVKRKNQAAKSVFSSGTKRREALFLCTGGIGAFLLDVVQATGVRLQNGRVVEHLV